MIKENKKQILDFAIDVMGALIVVVIGSLTIKAIVGV